MREKFEWDEVNRERNLAKHGLDFVEVSEFHWEQALVVVDQRKEYGEDRFVAYGPLQGRVVIVVFSRREGIIRVISLRRANEREKRFYESKIKD
jgi:uncharacterized protein